MLSAFDILWLVLPIIFGYIVGSINESRHYASIRQRERAMQGKALVFNLPNPPVLAGTPQLRLVAGSVVVSVDAFKRIAAKLHSFFGGRVVAYESLVDRARREAILRMREKADHLGASMIFGVRIETSSINGGDPRRTMGVELIAYGTALIPDHTVAAAPAPWGARA